jgi:glycosyltransferase involved in cell wall biosynthesis
MKIGIDIRVLLDQKYSGVASFSFHLIKNLIKLDKHNAYYFFYNSFKKAELPTFLKGLNIKSSCYPNKFFNYIAQKIFKRPQLDRVVGGTDIFYLPHFNFASFSRNSKKIITVHDLSFLHYPEFFSFRKNFWHRALNLKKNLKSFDIIVAVSEHTKRDLIDLLNIPAEKIRVVYPGVSDKLMSEIEDSSLDMVRKKYNLNSDFILYLGTIEPRKNIIGLIEAYNLARQSGLEADLVLAGSWGWKTKSIKEKWQSSHYKNNIKFLSYVEEAEKPALYKLARLFVYPSFYEGFGFPPLEALYFSLPVISSNVSSLPEVLGDSALLINPNNSSEIAEAIKILWTDETYRQKLIAKGLERIRKFDWALSSEQYLKIFYEAGKE